MQVFSKDSDLRNLWDQSQTFGIWNPSVTDQKLTLAVWKLARMKMVSRRLALGKWTGTMLCRDLPEEEMFEG